jgi:3-methyl-2-oxobutanoate hydroxymethyltransferase
VSVPTIGIGAGRYCDGQVQVVLDIAGLSERVFRHARAYGDLGNQLCSIVSAYAGDVRNGGFPAEENASRLPDEVFAEVKHWCDQQQKGEQGQ